MDPSTRATVTPLRDRATIQSSRWWTTTQEQAIAALYPLSDLDIFAPLASLRSVASQLTDPQLAALICLRSASDHDIKTWLDCSRRISNSIQSERSSLTSSFSDPRFSSASWSTNNTSSSASSFIAPPESNLQTEVRTALHLNKPLPHDASQGMLAPQEPLATQRGTQHQRWCTTREHRNVFRTFAGFAKHEKEHDDFYQFLPQGPVEKTSSGRQCALCTTKDPSEAHLQDHNILRYEGRLRGAITRSRKVNFEHLLKRHNTPEEYIKVLVDRWRKPAGKKTYSCGFCVAIFPTLPDRSSHIDREHFAKGQHIDDWDDFKVIKGLLLQPEVRQECQRLFNPVDPSRPETKISWPPSKIDALRLRLEIGSDPASELARDAFREARIDRLRPSTPNMRLLSDDRGHTHMPPSNQIHFAFGREIPTTSPHHDQLGLPRDTSSVQTAAKSDETAALDISLMSVPSPPEDLPPMVTSHGYPTRSSSLATRAACDSDFEFSGSANPFEAQHLSSVSQMMHNDLPQQDASDGALSQAEKPFLSPSISNYSFHQHSPYVLSTAGTPSHIAFQINSLEKETFNTSLEESAVPIPLPKRKLSDKSANDANLKAQTQAPSSTFNQDYSTEYGDLAYANTNVFEHWDSSYRM